MLWKHGSMRRCKNLRKFKISICIRSATGGDYFGKREHLRQCQKLRKTILIFILIRSASPEENQRWRTASPSATQCSKRPGSFCLIIITIIITIIIIMIIIISTWTDMTISAVSGSAIILFLASQRYTALLSSGCKGFSKNHLQENSIAALNLFIL